MRASGELALDAGVRHSVVAQIAKSPEVPDGAEERLLDEALRFLALSAELSARGEDSRLVPSVRVDAAWHAFILHTRAYAELCERAFGEYVHHDPSPPDAPVELGNVVDYLRTRVLMEERYGALDEELWPLP
ncbi:MAG: hypothetical protein QOK25_2405 [Thermoleophilaceae bacterium]|nr:hypothetical protein [Thermoleophilaceae bacterium]